MSALERARLVISTPLTMYSPTVELIPLIRELVEKIDALGAHVHPVTYRAIIE